MYKVYYYDSSDDSYNCYLSFRTLLEAEHEVSALIKSNYDPDVTAYYIEWVEDGFLREIGYYRTCTGWERE